MEADYYDTKVRLDKKLPSEHQNQNDYGGDKRDCKLRRLARCDLFHAPT